MKTLPWVACVASIMSVFADDALLSAIRNGAEVSIQYRVVDENGMSVSNATAHVWLMSYGRSADNVDYVVTTDLNGCFVARGMTNDRVICCVEKTGYYASREEVLVRAEGRAHPLVQDGKWQPYDENRTISFKTVREPTVLLHSMDELHEIPAYNEWLGFDLEKSAWTPPFGSGIHKDVLMRFYRKVKNRQTDFWAQMEVSFTNNPFGGVYCARKDRNSELESMHRADVVASYKPSLDYSLSVGSFGKKSHMLGEDSYLVFRTRTATNEEGRLVSAHYGMIYGRWGFYGGMRAKEVFFNPVPNDTNLEPKREAMSQP